MSQHVQVKSRHLNHKPYKTLILPLKLSRWGGGGGKLSDILNLRITVPESRV
jgi:hypothetical protein